MPTQITRDDGAAGEPIVLRVEGEMFREDAVLIERLAKEIAEEDQTTVVIDLADLDFMDSEAASILKRLQDAFKVEIEGVEIFLQSAVDLAERA